MMPKPTPQQIAAMSQQQLADLAKQNPDLAAQILLTRQGINTSSPAGLPPQYAGLYPATGEAHVQDPSGRMIARQSLASGDTRVAPALNDTVLGTMGNAVGDRMKADANDNLSRAALGSFYRRYRGAREK